LERRQEGRAATGTASGQPRYLLGEDTPRAPRHRAPEAAHAKVQDGLAAGNRQISDLARVAAVHAVRTPTAAGAAGGTRGPMQINLHGVVSDDDLLDVQAGKMGHGDRDAQGAPPAGSRSPERASYQYYVSWSACTENEPEPNNVPFRQQTRPTTDATVRNLPGHPSYQVALTTRGYASTMRIA
jgi:hypothetical protein